MNSIVGAILCDENTCQTNREDKAGSQTADLCLVLGANSLNGSGFDQMVHRLLSAIARYASVRALCCFMLLRF